MEENKFDVSVQLIQGGSLLGVSEITKADKITKFSAKGVNFKPGTEVRLGFDYSNTGVTLVYLDFEVPGEKIESILFEQHLPKNYLRAGDIWIDANLCEVMGAEAAYAKALATYFTPFTRIAISREVLEGKYDVLVVVGTIEIEGRPKWTGSVEFDTDRFQNLING